MQAGRGCFPLGHGMIGICFGVLPFPFNKGNGVFCLNPLMFFQPFSSETQLANPSNSVSSPKTCRWCVSPAKHRLPLSISVSRPESTIRWLSVPQIIQSCGLCCIVQKSLGMPYVWRIHGRRSIKWAHVVWTSPSHCLSFSYMCLLAASWIMVFLKDLWL